MNFIKPLLLILIILLPIVSSTGLSFLGLTDNYFRISGNFELSKVIFFNIFSTIIIGLGGLYIIKNKLFTNKKLFTYTFILYIILYISSVFSMAFFDSTFLNNTKGHSFLMFSNLIGIFIVLYHIIDKQFIKELKYTIYISTFLFSLVGIKEYFLPSFDYGDLQNRLIGTFGHPNYVAGLLLITFPLFYNNLLEIIKKKNLKIALLLLFHFVIILIAFILTKSIIPFMIFLLFNLYFFYINFNFKYKKGLLGISLFLGIIIISYIIMNFGIITKLSSFISRFFIWQTTLNIIFDNVKIFLIGGGLDTLGFIFNSYKVPELYIFENIGLIADRPHNFLLNVFYHLGLFGLLYFVFLIFKFLKLGFINKKELNKNPIYIGIFLLILFLLFNFANIVIYYFLIIYISILIYNQSSNLYSIKNKNNKIYNIFIGFIMILSLIGSIISIHYYSLEMKLFKNQEISTNGIILNPNVYKKYNDYEKYNIFFQIKTDDYYRMKIRSSSEQLLEMGNTLQDKNEMVSIINTIKDLCLGYITQYNNVENYFYCGDIFYLLSKETNIDLTIDGKKYYLEGVKKLPDIYNKNSIYYYKWYGKAFTNHRFLHPKFGIVQKLEILDIKY